MGDVTYLINYSRKTFNAIKIGEGPRSYKGVFEHFDCLDLIALRDYVGKTVWARMDKGNKSFLCQTKITNVEDSNVYIDQLGAKSKTEFKIGVYFVPESRIKLHYYGGFLGEYLTLEDKVE